MNVSAMRDKSVAKIFTEALTDDVAMETKDAIQTEKYILFCIISKYNNIDKQI